MTEHEIPALRELRESLREAARRDIAARAPRRRRRRVLLGSLAVLLAGGAAAGAAAAGGGADATVAGFFFAHAAVQASRSIRTMVARVMSVLNSTTTAWRCCRRA
jgi:hypothetical protein